jgi:serine/tyrosine/threonine adenylyltransferase
LPFRFDNSYARLPETFYRRCNPSPVAAPRLIQLNQALATELGLSQDELSSDDLALIFSGNVLPAGADPIATAYAGHQFGGFNPQLGDGRAVLLGEVIDVDGQRRDLQLKGAGKTPFSRGGDGRSPLGPVIREYLISEAMHALGVPTTRALAALTTGEQVYREQALPGGILVRIASSHIRVGTFQFFAARRDHEGLRQLADHVIARHYPQVAEQPQPYLALLDAVITGQARLIAQWMSLGFVHGVMNTDNMLVSGETIDYGPCAYLNAYHPETVFSSIDRGGRYAYQMQPAIAQWNMARFAETLLPLLADDEDAAVASATDAIRGFVEIYEQAWLERMAAKLGVQSVTDGDRQLVDDLLKLMDDNNVDFTLLFHRLGEAVITPQSAACRDLFADSAGWDEWAARWLARLQLQPLAPALRSAQMRHVNPAVIPRNHRIAEAIEKADQGDFSEFERLARVLVQPFAVSDDDLDWMAPPPQERQVCTTFCGT